jgi:hypothetical protein
MQGRLGMYVCESMWARDPEHDCVIVSVIVHKRVAVAKQLGI